MSFLEKYLIVAKLEVPETMSFQAQNTLTGQAVLLHQLLPGRTPPDEVELATLVFKYLANPGAPGDRTLFGNGRRGGPRLRRNQGCAGVRGPS